MIKNNLSAVPPSPNDYQIIKQTRDSMRKLFADKVKFSFLWKMMGRTIEALGTDFLTLFDYSIAPERIISGDTPAAQYEICKTIIGIHHSNSIFLSDEQIAKNEQDEEYQQALLKEVTLHLAFRGDSAEYFKKKQFWIGGDEFIFFPVPYKLFVLCTNAIHTLNSFGKANDDALKAFYDKLFNKALAALTLLEGNFFDSAYPICRAVMELYVKLLMVELYPGLLDKYSEYARIEIETACCGRRYSESFNREYDNRKNKGDKVKANYLHFGWVDLLDDYHEIVPHSPYSMNGLLNYLEKKQQINLDYDGLRFLYKNCHAYVHGTVGITGYPLLHYFEISIMLGMIIPHSYNQMFQHIQNRDNLLLNGTFESSLRKNITQLIEQYTSRNTERFELYYQQQKKRQHL